MVDGLPAEVRQFLSDHITSVAQLEVLWLLRREPQRQWNSAEIGAALYMSPKMMAPQLAELHAHGLVSAVGDSETLYKFGPASQNLDHLVIQSLELYKERSVSVISEIHSRPADKVRTFADAFRLRKEEP